MKKKVHSVIVHLDTYKSVWFLLLLLFPLVSFGQDSLKRVVMNESDIEEIITYTARDSNYTDLKKKQIHLFGEAKLNYGSVFMTADYILVDYGKNEVLATYTTDSLGRRIGQPLFVDNGDTLRAATLRYNFESKKGYIQEVAIQQDEYYLSMEKAKRQPNEEIHFVHGKFTTCNLTDPHYHFFLSKAVMVPDKRIVTGPVNLWVMGVPTPLGLPFAMIPQKKKRDKINGFILPQYSLISQYGSGFKDLGYYFPINERFQTIAYLTLYSRGSVGVRNYSEYAKRYKFTGNFDLGYSRFRFGFPDSTVLNATSVIWNHIQDPKANPNWSFNSSVNFNSNSSNKQTLNPQNPQYFNNTLNSDIRLGKRFGAKPISAEMKINMRQNTATQRIDLTSPILNFQTTSRIYPFKKVNKIVGFTYGAEIQNKSTFKTSYLKDRYYDSIARLYRNGANQKFNLQATFSLLKGTLRFTPSVNYSQFYNAQTIDKTVNPLTNTVIVDTISKGGFSHSFTSSASLTTSLYSYYRFIGKRKTVLRHVMTPTVSFNYSPFIQQGVTNYTDTAGRVIQYNKFERSIYTEGVGKSSGVVNIGVNNSFEIKQKSASDTVTGFKKTRIIENLFLSTTYDIFKDSMRWGDIQGRMVINPNEFININVTATHSIYSWNEATGATINAYAFNTNQGVGRITNASFATTFILTTKKNRELLQNRSLQMAETWNPQYQNWLINPSQIVMFDIPWKLNFTHVLSYSLNRDSISYNRKHYSPTNTLQASGDFSITENWKIGSTLYLDLNAGKVSNLNFTLFRNIHCWNVGFTWTPIGTNKNFGISFRGNASALQNANINIRKPPLVIP